MSALLLVSASAATASHVPLTGPSLAPAQTAEHASRHQEKNLWDAWMMMMLMMKGMLRAVRKVVMGQIGHLVLRPACLVVMTAVDADAAAICLVVAEGRTSLSLVIGPAMTTSAAVADDDEAVSQQRILPSAEVWTSVETMMMMSDRVGALTWPSSVVVTAC